MPNRIIKETICTSENLNGLAPEEEILFYRLIVQCDDFGRLEANPAIVRAKCFPLRTDDIKCKQVEAWLLSLESHQLLTLYQANGKKYLQMETWAKHQRIRAEKSKYPTPEAKTRTSADICGHLRTNAPVIEDEDENRNRITRIEDEDDNGNSSLSLSDKQVTGEKNVFKIYEDEKFGKITETTRNTLVDACETFTDDFVCDAMKEAVKQNKRSWAYVEGILKNWASEGRDAEAVPARIYRNEPNERTKTALVKAKGTIEDIQAELVRGKPT